MFRMFPRRYFKSQMDTIKSSVCKNRELRVERVSGLDVKAYQDHFETGVHGFAFGDFDRYGKLSIWNACKTMELNRYIMAPFYQIVTDSFFLISSGEKWSVNKLLYQKAAMSHPMVYRCFPGARYKKSFTFIATLHEKRSDIELMSSERHIFFFDQNTKQVISIPSNHKASKIPKSSNEFDIPISEKPELAHKIIVVPRLSDHDAYQHVSSTCYIRWMMDAASEAAAAGSLPNFSKTFDYSAEFVEVAYIRQCHAGDLLDVHVWEEGDMCLCFQVDNRDGKGLTTFGRIKFFPDVFKSQL